MDVTFRPLITAKIMHICLCLIVVAVSNTLGQETLNETGTDFTTSSPISNGFVFIEGQYVGAPYVVSRKNLTICINDKIIADYAPLIKGMSSAPKKYIHDRPAVPIGISTNAGSGDPIVKEYLSQLMSHLVSNQYGDAIANEMENGLKMLPCIKNITRDTNNPNRAIIDYKNGETSTMRLAPLSRKPAITPDTVVDHVSQACRRYVKRLEKGDLYSFSNGGSRIHTFGAGTAKEVMPDVVKVLCSSLDDEAKAKQLAGMLGMADVPKEESSAFVQNLDPSKQLGERVKALLNSQ